MTRTRKPTDATMRNVRSSAGRLAKLEARVKALARRLATLEAEGVLAAALKATKIYRGNRKRR